MHAPFSLFVLLGIETCKPAEYSWTDNKIALVKAQRWSSMSQQEILWCRGRKKGEMKKKKKETM